MSSMASVAIQTETQRALPWQGPKLRLLPHAGEPDATGGDGGEDAPPKLRLVATGAEDVRPVLVAGSDVQGRASVCRQMARTMPPSTAFEQAGAVWEVLVRAGESSMVILSGELEEMPAESVMQMIAHRHPEVPVVCLEPAAGAAV
jgi:hypothetical protein